MQRAIDKGQVRKEEKNNLLRDKFWRSLRSERLKSATKYEFRTVLDFEQLVKAVRTEELSMNTNAKAQHQAVTTNVASAGPMTERAGTPNQDLMTQTLREIQKGLKQINKRREYRYPKQNQRGRGQQQGGQQQNNRPYGQQQRKLSNLEEIRINNNNNNNRTNNNRVNNNRTNHREFNKRISSRIKQIPIDQTKRL